MAPARRVLKVQVDDSGTESGSEESDSDLDCHHRICLATGEGPGQDAILGMDFMVPAGVWLDLADGTMCFPNEKWIQLSGRRPLYG
ncbi:hypothetical protein PC116_g10672 [Phytophthora cactorum]|nr:hypothetical protein PC116_g10672 [Phytophthora cactorum]